MGSRSLLELFRTAPIRVGVEKCHQIAMFERSAHFPAGRDESGQQARARLFARMHHVRLNISSGGASEEREPLAIGLIERLKIVFERRHGTGYYRFGNQCQQNYYRIGVFTFAVNKDLLAR
jgi:hypothetical protein